MAGGLRASGPKADLALIVSDVDAVVAGSFTTNVMCAAPVLYCKQVLAKNKPARAVSITSGLQPGTVHACSLRPFARSGHTCMLVQSKCGNRIDNQMAKGGQGSLPQHDIISMGSIIFSAITALMPITLAGAFLTCIGPGLTGYKDAANSQTPMLFIAACLASPP